MLHTIVISVKVNRPAPLTTRDRIGMVFAWVRKMLSPNTLEVVMKRAAAECLCVSLAE